MSRSGQPDKGASFHGRRFPPVLTNETPAWSDMPNAQRAYTLNEGETPARAPHPDWAPEVACSISRSLNAPANSLSSGSSAGTRQTREPYTFVQMGDLERVHEGPHSASASAASLVGPGSPARRPSNPVTEPEAEAPAARSESKDGGSDFGKVESGKNSSLRRLIPCRLSLGRDGSSLLHAPGMHANSHGAPALSLSSDGGFSLGSCEGSIAGPCPVESAGHLESTPVTANTQPSNADFQRSSAVLPRQAAQAGHEIHALHCQSAPATRPQERQKALLPPRPPAQAPLDSVSADSRRVDSAASQGITHCQLRERRVASSVYSQMPRHQTRGGVSAQGFLKADDNGISFSTGQPPLPAGTPGKASALHPGKPEREEMSLNWGCGESRLQGNHCCCIGSEDRSRGYASTCSFASLSSVSTTGSNTPPFFRAQVPGIFESPREKREAIHPLELEMTLNASQPALTEARTAFHPGGPGFRDNHVGLSGQPCTSIVSPTLRSPGAPPLKLNVIQTSPVAPRFVDIYTGDRTAHPSFAERQESQSQQTPPVGRNLASNASRMYTAAAPTTGQLPFSPGTLTPFPLSLAPHKPSAPFSVLLTLPLNLPFGRIIKIGAASQGSNLPGTTCARSLAAKKSYYCFSPVLQEAAHTLFSHAGGICDTFAASLHLELAILYVPQCLLPRIGSLFNELATRFLPRFEGPLKMECGGLQERSAPGRFGGKVLTVSCAIRQAQERQKFQQMQEFLVEFQRAVENLLREYEIYQQRIIPGVHETGSCCLRTRLPCACLASQGGRQETPAMAHPSLTAHRPSTAWHGVPQGAGSAAGRRHNIWRYSLACVPSVVPGSAQTPSYGLTGPRNCSGAGDSGRPLPNAMDLTGGSLDLTVRAFETRELEKPPHEYAHLVVRDISISEVRLVTTRSIDGLTSEIDPRFEAFCIGTRPILKTPEGQLCRHSFAPHELPDIWEVRVNSQAQLTREQQKRLVEQYVVGEIEERPAHEQRRILDAITLLGGALLVNGQAVHEQAAQGLSVREITSDRSRSDVAENDCSCRGSRVEIERSLTWCQQTRQATIAGFQAADSQHSIVNNRLLPSDMNCLLARSPVSCLPLLSSTNIDRSNDSALRHMSAARNKMSPLPREEESYCREGRRHEEAFYEDSMPFLPPSACQLTATGVHSGTASQFGTPAGGAPGAIQQSTSRHGSVFEAPGLWLELPARRLLAADADNPGGSLPTENREMLAISREPRESRGAGRWSVDESSAAGLAGSIRSLPRFRKPSQEPRY